MLRKLLFRTITLEDNRSVVKIRLMRTGKKHAPSYRIVATDSHAPRDGRFLEILGWYNPLVNPPAIHFDEEKTAAWILNGAQPTESVARLFRTSGFAERLEAKKQERRAASAAQS
jgi:small subunit ribosomal protein S16